MNRGKGLRNFAAAAATALTLAATGASAQTPSATAQGDDSSLVARGEYVAKAADCMPCHTATGGGERFAGGLALNTPFGAIYSRNITSDPDNGIGTWSFDDFRRAVRDGIGKKGEYLYPAMPFDSYTKIGDDDLKALWAYVRRIAPANQPNKPNALAFPFNVRLSLLGWRELFFTDARFQPNPTKTADWNRGAYIVEALAHCGDCHTPRNIFGATESGSALQGAALDTWYAPSITTDTLKNLDGWNKAALINYLKTGASPRSTSFGPMNEVVHDSLAFLSGDDLNAIATYLLDRPARSGKRKPQAASTMLGKAHDRAATAYVDNCLACHQDKGAGLAGSIPALAGNPAVTAGEPYDVISVILGGIKAQGKFGAMPAFAGTFSDQTVADLANYVRTSWGNNAAPNATPDMVSAFRAGIRTTPAGDEAARTLQCPQVGSGPGATNDPTVTAELTRLMSDSSLNVSKLVDAYRNANPGVDFAGTVNGLNAAFCPLVAQGGQDVAVKRAILDRFSSAVARYTASLSAPPSVPDMGIVWAVPAGPTLVGKLPSGYKPFACPSDSAASLPSGLTASLASLTSGLGPRVPASNVATIAQQALAIQPKAKPADVADGVIVNFCRTLAAITTLTPAEKSAALTLFGENLIDDLQGMIEAARVKKTASK